MNIVFFSNPVFFGSEKQPVFTSMARFTSMLAEGMIARGHRVSIWAPASVFFNLPLSGIFKKWLGYIDQYLLFPSEVRKRLNECPDDTLFVFTDQAQGPWIPLVSKRKHVMHCHDFLAQQSALDQIPSQRTSWTGKKYQRYIRDGYQSGKHFICTSNKTKSDLKALLKSEEPMIDMVYNGLDEKYQPMNANDSRLILSNKIGVALADGYLLHIGSNVWYKNRQGVVEMYNAWREQTEQVLPLILIGESPSKQLVKFVKASPFAADIHFVVGLSDAYVRSAYAGASVFLFPSLAEGFGWPIAEAMGSGCPVITTASAPMTEVAGNAGFLLPAKEENLTEVWAQNGAKLINHILSLSEKERALVREKSVQNAKRFNMNAALDRIENIYASIYSSQKVQLQN